MRGPGMAEWLQFRTRCSDEAASTFHSLYITVTVHSHRSSRCFSKMKVAVTALQECICTSPAVASLSGGDEHVTITICPDFPLNIKRKKCMSCTSCSSCFPDLEDHEFLLAALARNGDTLRYVDESHCHVFQGSCAESPKLFWISGNRNKHGQKIRIHKDRDHGRLSRLDMTRLLLLRWLM